MTSLPRPDQYSDPVAFLRASHVVVLGCLNRLEALVTRAEKEGIVLDQVNRDAWADLLHFFSVVVVVHERDEELALFPVVLRKVPHTGFQPQHSSMRFLLEGHKLQEQKALKLVREWQQFASEAGQPSHESEKEFLAAVRALIREYHSHIKVEEELVYAKANDLLTPAERELVMQVMIGNHTPEVLSGILQFDRPTATQQIGNFTVGSTRSDDGSEDVDATGESLESDEPDEEDEEEDKSQSQKRS